MALPRYTLASRNDSWSRQPRALHCEHEPPGYCVFIGFKHLYLVALCAALSPAGSVSVEGNNGSDRGGGVGREGLSPSAKGVHHNSKIPILKNTAARYYATHSLRPLPRGAMCKEVAGRLKRWFLPQHFAAVVWIICQVRQGLVDEITGDAGATIDP